MKSKYQDALNSLNPNYIGEQEYSWRKATEILQELVDKETSMEVNMEDYHLEDEYQYPIYSCPKCGKYINDEDNYCRHCGQRVYFEESEE